LGRWPGALENGVVGPMQSMVVVGDKVGYATHWRYNVAYALGNNYKKGNDRHMRNAQFTL